MARVADGALIGDTRTGALASRGGLIDRLRVARLDSGAVLSERYGSPAEAEDGQDRP